MWWQVHADRLAEILHYSNQSPCLSEVLGHLWRENDLLGFDWMDRQRTKK